MSSKSPAVITSAKKSLEIAAALEKDTFVYKSKEHQKNGGINF